MGEDAACLEIPIEGDTMYIVRGAVSPKSPLLGPKCFPGSSREIQLEERLGGVFKSPISDTLSGRCCVSTAF